MKFRKTVTAAVLATGAVLATPSTALAVSPYAECHTFVKAPDKSGTPAQVWGEASITCQSGHIDEGIPVLGERIIDMYIRAELQSRSLASDNKWVVRDEYFESHGGSGTLRTPLHVRCFGEQKTVWRVVVTEAFGVEQSGEVHGVVNLAGSEVALLCG